MRRSSRAWEEWTLASNEPDGAPSASPRSSHTPLQSSQSVGRMSRTSVISFNSTAGTRSLDVSHHVSPTLRIGSGLGIPTMPAIIMRVSTGLEQRSGVEGSHAKTYRSPASGPGSEVSDPSSPLHSSTLWSDIDLQPSSRRTSSASSPAMPVETLGVSSVRWGTSGTGGPTGFSTLNGSECPSDGEGCSCLPSTLVDILTPTAPPRFSLSARAAAGIIRRSERRGRTLPAELVDALRALAGTPPPSSDDGSMLTESRKLSPPGTTSHLTPSSAAIRRLTPVECERLMGWPDGWTIAKGWMRSSRALSIEDRPAPVARVSTRRWQRTASSSSDAPVRKRTSSRSA